MNADTQKNGPNSPLVAICRSVSGQSVAAGGGGGLELQTKVREDFSITEKALKPPFPSEICISIPISCLLTMLYSVIQ